MVSSLETMTFLAFPSMDKVVFSSFIPSSSLINWPPVKIAMSSNIAFLLSPNPGALTAHTLNPARSLLTTKVAKASPSISSAIINRGRPDSATCCKTGRKSLIPEIFLS
ncbi:Uncharacterised protein [Chlamydia abortus]|nr:Uncharacterised protein [Chlamydia abortus]